MDKYLLRTPSNSSLNSKRSTDDQEWQTAKRPAIMKNSSSDNTSGELPTFNRYQNLTVDNDTESAKKINNPAPSIGRPGRIPPVILEIDHNWTHQKLQEMIKTFANSFHLHYRGKNKVAVICYTPAAHEAIKEGLRSNKIHFLTYSRKDEKVPKLVIRGLPADLSDNVSQELVNMGFKVDSVTVLKSSNQKVAPFPPLLVQLSPGSDPTKLKQVKYLFNCVITIEKFKPNRSSGTQCYRCQNFGHSSKNCNMPPRCVKCAENHTTADCQKKDRHEPARCCNCGQDHPANYRECNARVLYVESLRKKMNDRKPPAATLRLPKRTLDLAKPALQTPAETPLTRSWAALLAGPPKQSPFKKPLVVEPTSDNKPMDSITSEILEIMETIKKIRAEFQSCNSMFDKIMLVLKHLGHHI